MEFTRCRITRLNDHILIGSLAVMLGTSSNAMAQLCSGKDDSGSRIHAQLVVPQVELRARFWRELQRYAAKNSLDYSESEYGIGKLKGRTVISLLKHFRIATSIDIALITTDKSDIFDVELRTCNLDQDWQP